jgi:hypothetical protein
MSIAKCCKSIPVAALLLFAASVTSLIFWRVQIRKAIDAVSDLTLDSSVAQDLSKVKSECVEACGVTSSFGHARVPSTAHSDHMVWLIVSG